MSHYSPKKKYYKYWSVVLPPSPLRPPPPSKIKNEKPTAPNRFRFTRFASAFPYHSLLPSRLLSHISVEHFTYSSHPTPPLSLPCPPQHRVMSICHVILSCHYVCVILSYTYVILSYTYTYSLQTKYDYIWIIYM